MQSIFRHLSDTSPKEFIAQLNAGADPNPIDGGGRTPLMLSVHRGDIPRIQALLAAKANIFIKDKLGWSAIHEAAGSPNPAVPKILKDAGADVNERGPMGITPIMQAAGLGNLSLLKAFLQLGANPNLRDEKGRSAMDHAKIQHEVQTQKHLESLLEPEIEPG